jgi:hypothetical protein
MMSVLLAAGDAGFVDKLSIADRLAERPRRVSGGRWGLVDPPACARR